MTAVTKHIKSHKGPYWTQAGHKTRHIVVTPRTLPSEIMPVSELHEISLTYRRLEGRYQNGAGTSCVVFNKASNSNDLQTIVRNLFYGDDNDRSITDVEFFGVAMMNRNNRVFAFQEIGRGGLTGVISDSRIIFSSALLVRAAAIAVFHNHPSGNNQPSDADMRMTKDLVAAGTLLNIPVLDHIILTEGGYYSFADEGMI